MENNNKGKPIKSISWGNFQLTEWENERMGETYRNFSLSRLVWNKETKKSETQSSLQLDKKQDISIIYYLLNLAYLGKLKTYVDGVAFHEINQYKIELLEKDGKIIIKKKYFNKENEIKYSELILLYRHDVLYLLDLLRRCFALLIIPFKYRENQNSATNIASEDNEFIDETGDDDIPF